MNKIPVVKFFFVESAIIWSALLAEKIGLNANYFLILSIVYILWIFYVAYGTLHTDMLNAKTEYANSIRGMKLYELDAAGFHPPSFRTILNHGRLINYFENTSVTVDVWREFLRTSNSVQCSPKRDWTQNSEKQAEYKEIMNWLRERGYVMRHKPPQGNVSWRWSDRNLHGRLMAHWRKPIQNLALLDAI